MSELLIVGGLTIDRFADGRSAPGGSVLHAGLAAVAMGVRPTFLTVAGRESEAVDGLARLSTLGELRHQPAMSTTTYRHEESAGRRVLVYEARTDPIRPADDIPPSRICLLAPIADEVSPETVEMVRRSTRPKLTVMLIQGWLRHLELAAPVHPLVLDDVPGEVWQIFSVADAIVVSNEDLAETPEDPFAQAIALRGRIGDGPVLVVTLGQEGYLLDDPRTDRMVASIPRRVVAGVPTVGAGDIFGAILALRLARGDGPVQAADGATDGVIRMLESRR